jgi:hypothetical protein
VSHSLFQLQVPSPVGNAGSKAVWSTRSEEDADMAEKHDKRGGGLVAVGRMVKSKRERGLSLSSARRCIVCLSVCLSVCIPARCSGPFQKSSFRNSN